MGVVGLLLSSQVRRSIANARQSAVPSCPDGVLRGTYFT